MVSRIKEIWMDFWFSQNFENGHYVPKFKWGMISNSILIMGMIALVYAYIKFVADS